MPKVTSRDRRKSAFFPSLVLSAVASVALFSTLLASPEGTRVLLIVPAGAELAEIDRARSAVPARERTLLVADSDRVRVKGGLEVVVDLSLASAPPADVVVLLEGEPGRAEEAFLMERRKSARAVLLPPGSPLAERLKGAGGGALILVGRSDSIPAVLAAVGETGAGEPPAPRPSPAAVASPRAVAEAPAATPTGTPSGRVFDRYFSSSRPTPTPTPR
jgi:hypothetical protein